ncbi:RES family NAD+ phosphorylase [Parvularcula oceani]|uniref:RES family NAD+ phosphorylase n=1 Tax=Parvularcula oceani TaxID=1247963 RepID=UPI000A7DC21E|nr:RES family NAD+ phosphorylase [Parvularcula oceani]
MLAYLEGRTSGRLRAEREGLSALDARELSFRTWGSTIVNAAFAYTRPEGNRFNGPGRGAWYCAFEDMTAIAEVGFHRTRELRRIGVFEDEAVYQTYLADFIGRFRDARTENAKTALPPFLQPEPNVAYPAGQQLAERLRSLDPPARGLVYPSARRPGGTCLVAFHPQVVQDVRPGARWRFVWDGSPDFTVKQDVDG